MRRLRSMHYYPSISTSCTTFCGVFCLMHKILLSALKTHENEPTKCIMKFYLTRPCTLSWSHNIFPEMTIFLNNKHLDYAKKKVGNTLICLALYKHVMSCLARFLCFQIWKMIMALKHYKTPSVWLGKKIYKCKCINICGKNRSHSLGSKHIFLHCGMEYQLALLISGEATRFVCFF